ncbi:hypothetical protein E2986_10999 [Frieseomelitta varia]|uniref:RING-type domain-containing protein n=1 Tax=Frieseomelitta varia TaxID=561572 RepID=A0A833VUM8_9HYME|nr:hypothetical protein E2986_10999 [Frieseomelitta varia]
MPNVTFVTVLIGVTVATVLYFIFGTNKQRTQQQYYQYPAERYSDDNRPDNTSKECSICLVPLKRKDLYILPCEHEFHKVCIEEWKNQSPGVSDTSKTVLQ